MKKLHSMEELRKEAGLKQLKKREAKEKKCFKCNSPMELIGNVYVCKNESLNDKGEIIKCNNFIIQHLTF